MERIKRVLCAAMVLAALMLSGCASPSGESAQGNPQETEVPAAATAAPEDKAEEPETTEQETEEENTLKITIGAYEFTVTLEDNATAAALKEHLPMTLDMSELNGNEKYNYLPFSLPTEPYNPGTIQSGDVMLYGRECIVVFYKSFSTSYSYTKIGHIDDPAQLQTAVGAGGVQMVFE